MAKRGSTFSPELVEAVEVAKRNVVAAAANLKKACDALSTAVRHEADVAEKALEDIEESAPDYPELTEQEHEKISEDYSRTTAPIVKALERRLRKIENSHVPDGSDLYNTVKGIIHDDCRVTILF